MGEQDGERLPARTVKAVNIRCGDKAPQTNIDQIRRFSGAGAPTVSQPERQTNNQHSTPDKGFHRARAGNSQSAARPGKEGDGGGGRTGEGRGRESAGVR